MNLRFNVERATSRNRSADDGFYVNSKKLFHFRRHKASEENYRMILTLTFFRFTSNKVKIIEIMKFRWWKSFTKPLERFLVLITHATHWTLFEVLFLFSCRSRLLFGVVTEEGKSSTIKAHSGLCTSRKRKRPSKLCQEGGFNINWLSLVH